VVVDLGTGDGRAVLAAALARPRTLAIGIDADAASMARASLRAARPAGRGGLPNALFVVAAAESLPTELAGLASSLTVQFPWGSLLRGLVRPDARIMAGIRDVLRRDGTLRVLLSVAPRDRRVGLDGVRAADLDRLRETYPRFGLEVREARPATREEVRASNSSWAKRLDAGTRREVWLLRARRDDGG
jgi:16S rRNA (adenine(1408)-N(1))-methyltransferase